MVHRRKGFLKKQEYLTVIQSTEGRKVTNNESWSFTFWNAESWVPFSERPSLDRTHPRASLCQGPLPWKMSLYHLRLARLVCLIHRHSSR